MNGLLKRSSSALRCRFPIYHKPHQFTQTHDPIWGLLQLETDQQLLIPKSRAALERYGHQVVIGNELHRRKFEVVFVSRRADDDVPDGEGDSGFVESWVRLQEGQTEIEAEIVQELVRRHGEWIESK